VFGGTLNPTLLLLLLLFSLQMEVPRKICEILYAKACILGNICAIIGLEWVHFAVLNTDVEAFLNQL